MALVFEETTGYPPVYPDLGPAIFKSDQDKLKKQGHKEIICASDVSGYS